MQLDTTLTNPAMNVDPAYSCSNASVTSPLEQEVDCLTEALSFKYEELSLIREFCQRLDLGKKTSTICRLLLSELHGCIQATTLAIELDAADDGDRDDAYGAEAIELDQGAAELHLHGDEIEASRLRWIVDAAIRQRNRVQGIREQEDCKHEDSQSSTITIANHLCLDGELYNAIVVPIERGGQTLGRMIAIRWQNEDEFGTTEADLMRSTSMMLGIHLVNQRQYDEMQLMFEGTIQSLVSALDAKDAYTCGHSSRVAELAVRLAGRLGYDEESLQRIQMAGVLHDIGKIGVEDSVLRKPGKLTDDEFEQIKIHPVLGFEILKGIRPFRKILPAVRHHHESWDGSGYPDGLKGDAIPRDAQVLAVADAFDAMTSNRPYRDGMPIERVLKIFAEGRGTQWASDVVDELMLCY
ncbi:HD domain-containing phosphohydrolase [Novipirellula aureliae]|nr:HD-GYP domain-containing protein [Novipirellula aureliae]